MYPVLSCPGSSALEEGGLERPSHTLPGPARSPAHARPGPQEFENAEGDEYAADLAQGSPATAAQNGPDVYVLPLTEVSLPMAKQPGRSGEGWVGRRGGLPPGPRCWVLGVTWGRQGDRKTQLWSGNSTGLGVAGGVDAVCGPGLPVAASQAALWGQRCMYLFLLGLEAGQGLAGSGTALGLQPALPKGCYAQGQGWALGQG